MVTIFKANCPCGLDQGNLRQGYRSDYKIFRFDIHFCPECKKLFDCWDEDPIHGPPEQTICPLCDEEPIESYTYLTSFAEIKHICSLCHQKSMKFTATGEWEEK